MRDFAQHPEVCALAANRRSKIALLREHGEDDLADSFEERLNSDLQLTILGDDGKVKRGG